MTKAERIRIIRLIYEIRIELEVMMMNLRIKKIEREPEDGE